MYTQPMRSSVGIVTRTRDRTLFLQRAVSAVLAQSCQDWYLVLVNDGGDPDALRSALQAAGLTDRIPEGRLTILDNPTSRGRAAAFNQGLAALDTDFVACLDDDDSWDPDFLTALTGFFRDNDALIPDLGGVAAMVTALREDVIDDPDGGQRIVALGEDGLPNAFQRSDFLLNPIAYATYRHDLYPVQWILRREAVLAAGGFPEAFEVMEDRAFLLRLLQSWRIAVLDRPLAFHHRRVRRAEDGAQSAEVNTLDNPSYDWRRFADLAMPPITQPEGAEAVDLPRLIRAVGASVVKELNDETSALWHKVNGEAAGLRARIDALEAQLAYGAPPQLRGFTEASDSAAQAPSVWSLWPTVGSAQQGFSLTPGHRFFERLELSHAGHGAGLLLHAEPDSRLMQLQVPQTGDWCALELVLEGLATPGGGLTCRVALDLPAGGLFETALVAIRQRGLGRSEHQITDPHVHSADSRETVILSRRVTPEALRAGVKKLSVILPRGAANLRVRIHDVSVSSD